MSGLIKVKIAKVPKGTVRSGGRTSGSIRSGASIEFAQRAVYAHYADEADKATQAERAKEADRLTPEAVKDLERAVLSKLFIPYLDTAAKTWADVRKDEDFNSVKIKTSLWTDGFLSARGLNPNGGGSGGAGKSYLSDLLDVDLDTLLDGQVLVYRDGKWTNETIEAASLAGYALESWVEANFIKTADANDTFVKKSGDTMTGMLTVSANQNMLLALYGPTNGSYIQFGNGGEGAEFGCYYTVGAYFLNDIFASKPTLCLDTNNINSAKFRYDGVKYTIWHAGNDGPGSGLDADLLDGRHMDDFMCRKTMYSRDSSIYDLRFNMGAYDKGDFPTGQYNAEYPTNYGVYLSIAPRDKNSAALIFIDSRNSGDGHVYVNTRRAGDPNTQYDGWRTLAYTTDNVASATKLQTARTIWGQSFDGTANVTGLIKADSGIQIGGTTDIGWYLDSSRICAGSDTARGVNVGSLLVSNAWADATKVPTNGIYSKGPVRIGDCTISWDAANGMLKFDKGLYSEGGVSAHGVNKNAGGGGSDSGNYLDINASNATYLAMPNLIAKISESDDLCPYDTDYFVVGDSSYGYDYCAKFKMTGLWRYIKGKADGSYLGADGAGATEFTLYNMMQPCMTNSAVDDNDLFFVASAEYSEGAVLYASSLWAYIKSKMGLAFTVDGDNVAIGCQPGTLTLNGVTINSGSAITCNSLTTQGVTAYDVTIGGPSANCVKIKYQGKTYTLQLAKLIQAGYLTA